MILSKEVKMKWHSRNVKYLTDKGYLYTGIGEEVVVKLEDVKKNSRVEIEIKCDYCDEIFKRKYTDCNRYKPKLTKDACKKCKGAKIVESNEIHYGVSSTSLIKEVKEKQIKSFTENNFIYTLEYISNYLTVYNYTLISYDEKINSFSKLYTLCPNGHEYTTDIHHFKNHKNRCSTCCGNILKSNEDFRDIVYKKVKDEYTILSDYIGANEKLNIKHNLCGNIYEVTPSSFLNNESRCPRCVEFKNSKGMNKIRDFLTSNNILFDVEVKYKDCVHLKCLPFDFKIDTICVEFDGEQHFKSVEYFGGNDSLASQITRDNIKNQYCIDNNIPLIRIPYWEKDNIEYIFQNILAYFNIHRLNNEIDKEIVERYLVDSKWNHDTYLSWQHKENRFWIHNGE